MPGEYSDDDAQSNHVGNGVVANGSAPQTPAVAVSKSDAAGVPKEVEHVMYSDIGITTLLNRLKQSIASARDFAAFLKKRSSIEEDQANGLKRLAKQTQDSIRRPESKQGTYLRQLEEVLRVHEKMADNGMQFALSLHQMHEDLNELSTNMERGRKNWKHEGLSAEKRASDAENLMEKAKAKYDGLAEDYDRARTGDSKGSRRMGLKGPKSAEQHEQDLLRKLQAADADYSTKVQTAKAQREELINQGRPQAVRALQELIAECDSGLALQLQKFSAFNEKLVLGNGLAISPISQEADGPAPHSMRDMVYAIDNEKDLHSYIINQTSKMPPPHSEIKYEQHPTLLPKQQTPATQNRQPSGTQAPPAAPITAASFSGPPQQNYGSTGSRHSYNTPEPARQTTPPAQEREPPLPQPPQNPAYSQPAPQSPSYQQAPSSQGQYSQPPYPTSAGSMRGFPSQQAGGATYGNGPASPAQATGAANLPPPLKPVFGVGLEDLFRRDGTAVPMVVYQCMQAVDLFGLDVEGIYRLSGTTSHVQQMKAVFDHDSSRVDFRNPAAFYHDVNSVAGLLKLFFRDLPDPLLTRERYNELIEAARIDDDIVRRDTLHAIVNSLPDAHYATLRALILHLNRVQEHYATNRMSTSNLAICFAPSLMGSHTGPQIADAGLQARIIDTILVNTYQIFDED